MLKNGKTTSNVLTNVTPAMARDWLDHSNTRNRNLRQTVVERLATDITEGRWIVTHQGIAFDSNGVLVDGQHRLQAIVLANIAVPCFVASGLDPSSRMVVDTNAKRTAYDSLTLSGYGEVTAQHVAVAKAMEVCDFSRKRGDRLTSVAQLAAYMESHMPAIQFAVSQLTSRGKKGVTTAPIGSVVARAWYTADRERLAEFCEVYASGEMQGEQDVAAITLRTFMLSTGSVNSRGRSQRAVVVRKAETALRYFLDRVPLRKLYAATKELFVISTDQGNSDT